MAWFSGLEIIMTSREGRNGWRPEEPEQLVRKVTQFDSKRRLSIPFVLLKFEALQDNAAQEPLV